MDFTHPWALWLLALIPVLWLVRPRPPLRRVLVAAPHLWPSRPTPEPRPSASRWRLTPLGWVRAGLAAALTGALAGPVVTATQDSIAIVLDASLSMQARDVATTRWASAVQAAQQLIRQEARGTQILVWAAGSTPRLLGSTRGSSLLPRAVGTATPTDGWADLEAAIDLATQHPSRPRRIVVLSDGRAPARSSSIEWLPIGHPVDNVAITSLVARRVRGSGGRLDITAVVRNHGSAARSTSLAFTADSGPATRRELTIEPRGSATVAGTLEIDQPESVVTAALDVADGLTADNTRYAVVRTASPIRVALAGRSGFLKTALQLLPDTVVVEPAQPHDVLVCAPCDQTPTDRRPRLVITPPAPQTRRAPLTVRADHAVLDGVPTSGMEVAAQAAPLLAGDVVLARAGSIPAIVLREVSGQPLIELRVDVEDPSLTLTPFFPLFVSNAVSWLSSAVTPPTEVRAGDPFVWRVPDMSAAAPARATVGAREVSAVWRGGSAVVADTSTVGVYQLAVGNHVVRFAVNAESREESDLSQAPSVSTPSRGLAAPTRGGGRSAVGVTWLLLAAALGLLGIEWRLRALAPASPLRWPSTASRLAIAGLVLAALVGLRLPSGTAALAGALVLDRSASVAPVAAVFQDAASRLMASLGASDQVGLVVFGASATVDRQVGQGAPSSVAIESDVDASATNLGRALRTARLALPPGDDRRLILFSDGRETAGNMAAEVRQAVADGVRIDVVLPPKELGSLARISRVVAPTTVRQGELFDVRVIVEGPEDAAGHVQLSGTGSTKDAAVRIPTEGSTVVTFAVRATDPGVLTLRATFLSSDAAVLGLAASTDTPVGAAVTVVGPLRVLWVGPGSSRAGTPLTLLPGTVVDRVGTKALQSAALTSYGAIVLEDVNPSTLTRGLHQALTRHIDSGAGLLVLGSEISLPVAPSGHPDFDGLLPVDTRPRSGGRGSPLALVVVFDKSGSMEEAVAGTSKMAFARQAVTNVARALPVGDSLGVIAFDAVPTTVAPLSPTRDAVRLDQALRALRPTGGTAIAPALTRATQWLRGAPGAARRHVLLITDGQTSGSDVTAVRQLVVSNKLVLSVVAVGAGPERAAIEALATASGGRAYFPDDVRLLPALVAREAAQMAGGRQVTEPFVAQVVDHRLTRGLEGAPRLGGYIVTAAKPNAEVLLRSHVNDPLLAIGRYGLGRVAVYTAALDSQWSDGFRRWTGAQPLMSRTLSWLARQTDDPPSIVASVRGTSSGIEVRVDTADELDAVTVDGAMRTPAGVDSRLSFEATAPGRYVAPSPAPAPGTYVATITLTPSGGAPSITIQRGLFWSVPQETDVMGVDTAALTALASATGGSVLPIDAPGLRDRRSGFRDGRPIFLGLALALFWVGHFGRMAQWLSQSGRHRLSEPLGRAA